MGVGWGVAVAEGIAKRSEMLGVTDDSVVLPGVEKCTFSAHSMSTIFLHSDVLIYSSWPLEPRGVYLADYAFPRRPLSSSSTTLTLPYP